MVNKYVSQSAVVLATTLTPQIYTKTNLFSREEKPILNQKLYVCLRSTSPFSASGKPPSWLRAKHAPVFWLPSLAYDVHRTRKGKKGLSFGKDARAREEKVEAPL